MCLIVMFEGYLNIWLIYCIMCNLLFIEVGVCYFDGCCVLFEEFDYFELFVVYVVCELVGMLCVVVLGLLLLLVLMLFVSSFWYCYLELCV